MKEYKKYIPYVLFYLLVFAFILIAIPASAQESFSYTGKIYLYENPMLKLWENEFTKAVENKEISCEILKDGCQETVIYGDVVTASMNNVLSARESVFPIGYAQHPVTGESMPVYYKEFNMAESDMVCVNLSHTLRVAVFYENFNDSRTIPYEDGTRLEVVQKGVREYLYFFGRDEILQSDTSKIQTYRSGDINSCIVRGFYEPFAKKVTNLLTFTTTYYAADGNLDISQDHGSGSVGELLPQYIFSDKVILNHQLLLSISAKVTEAYSDQFERDSDVEIEAIDLSSILEPDQILHVHIMHGPLSNRRIAFDSLFSRDLIFGKFDHFNEVSPNYALGVYDRDNLDNAVKNGTCFWAGEQELLGGVWIKNPSGSWPPLRVTFAEDVIFDHLGNIVEVPSPTQSCRDAYENITS